VLELVRNGVPYEIATALDETELAAWVVTLGELTTGQEFDWNRMKWIERR
jgi:hypothetical protein